MRLTRTTLTFPLPVTTVFKFLTNHENYATWYPDVKEVTSANTLPHGTIGKAYNETIGTPFGDSASFIIRVVESIPNKKFVTEGEWSPLLPRMEVTFNKISENQTQITWSLHSRNKNLIISWLISLLVKPYINKKSRIGIERLKTMLNMQEGN